MLATRTMPSLACGTGAFTRAFARRVEPGGRVIGLDASPTMLERARADTPSELPITYVLGDAHDFPVPDGSLDAICCYAALHLMADPEAVVAAAAAALRDGGRIALFTSARHETSPLCALDTVIGSLGGLRMFDRTEVTDLLARQGFVEIERRIEGVTQTVTATRTSRRKGPGGATS